MSYLILGVALLAGILLAGQWFVSADPRTLVRVLKWVLIGVIGAAVLFLILTGRFMLALWALPALLPWIMRARSAARMAKNFSRMAGAGGGGNSEVKTEYLRMILDHESGDISGEVLKGRHAGRALHDLSRNELLALHDDFIREDSESARLVEAFLDRLFPDWRQERDAWDDTQSNDTGGSMSRAEAYRVLGLEEDASDTDIKEAHHRLIAGIHPDRGGSAYLAAKINEARDVLLGA